MPNPSTDLSQDSISRQTKDYHTVIFDFDGTIAATLEAARVAYNNIASSSGYKQIAPEDIPILREEKLNDILKILGVSKLQAPSLLMKGRALLREELASVPVIEGMKEVLLAMKASSKLIGILTSNSAENVRLFLEANDLSDCIDSIQTTSSLAGKSRCLKRMLKSLEDDGRAQAGVIYVGDEVRDVEACQKVKIDVAAVTWGFNARSALVDAKPSYVVDSPEELLEIVGIANR